MFIGQHIWILTPPPPVHTPTTDCKIGTKMSHYNLNWFTPYTEAMTMWIRGMEFKIYSENKNFKYFLVSPFKTKSIPIKMCLHIYVPDIGFHRTGMWVKNFYYTEFES